LRLSNTSRGCLRWLICQVRRNLKPRFSTRLQCSRLIRSSLCSTAVPCVCVCVCGGACALVRVRCFHAAQRCNSNCSPPGSARPAISLPTLGIFPQSPALAALVRSLVVVWSLIASSLVDGRSRGPKIGAVREREQKRRRMENDGVATQFVAGIRPFASERQRTLLPLLYFRTRASACIMLSPNLPRLSVA
jgi:hypothetical protein